MRTVIKHIPGCNSVQAAKCKKHNVIFCSCESGGLCPECDMEMKSIPAVEHTPTPWIAEESSIRYEGQRDRLRKILIGTPRNEKGGRFIACEIQGPAQNMDADAAFICRAVNAHEELVKALRKYGRHTRDCDFELERGTCTCGFGLSDMHPLAKAEAHHDVNDAAEVARLRDAHDELILLIRAVVDTEDNLGIKSEWSNRAKIVIAKAEGNI